MIIRKDEIEFVNASEFYKFVSTNDLFGIIQLKEPLLDANGKLLIREKVNLNESLIKKITTLEGKYVSILRASLNKNLTDKLAERLAKEAIQKIEDQENSDILYHLFENNQTGVNNYKAIIQNAFYDPRIVIFLFRLLTEKKEFFDYCISLGLLTLAAVIQVPFQIRFVNRYAFLTGIFCDACLMDTEYWKEAITNGQDLTLIAKTSASFLTKNNLPTVIVNSIASADFQSLQIEQNPQFRVSLTTLNSISPSIEVPVDYQDAGTLEDDSPPEEDVSNLIEIIGEALKISKFITILQMKLAGSERLAEKLIAIFSYNVEREVFRKDMSNPMIAMFKEYQEAVAKARRIGAVENMCLYKPSAWAYPKPDPTQILCKNKVTECPYIVSGWDIKIVSDKDSIGYLGTRLFPGQYPKCKLEEHLLPKQDLKNKK